MIMIIKDRARRPLVTGKPSSIGVAPSGIGGIDGREMTYVAQIGDFRICVTKSQWLEMSAAFTKLDGG